MRILFVIPFYRPAFVYGGPVRSVPALCAGLVQQGAEVTVYTTNANGDEVLPVTANRESVVDGVRVTYFERTGSIPLFRSPDLAKACFSGVQDFDLVYVSSNWGYPFIPACRSAIAKNVRFVVAPRASFKRVTWKRKYLKKMAYHLLMERALINRATAIHFTTILELEDSSWLRLKPRPFVVPNLVNVEEFRTLAPDGSFRVAERIPESAKVVLYLGRLEPQKGIDISIEAFAHSGCARENVVLVVAGPEEEQYLRFLHGVARRNGVEEQVRFTGLLDGGRRLAALAEADMLILTSLSENFGMSVVEAMAAKLPVLVSDRVGIAKEVGAAGAGVVTPVDVQSVAAGLNEILDSATNRARMGHRGREFVEQQLAPERIAAEMMRMFSLVINA